MSEKTDPARSALAKRQQAYARKFAPDNFGDTDTVLDDLMKFCRFGESVFDPDQRKTDVLIGRQEVLHRILDHIGLDLDTLYAKYNTRRFNPRQP